MKSIIKKLIPKIQKITPEAIWAIIVKIKLKLFGWCEKHIETTKAKPRRLKEGFFDKYCQGKGLDIGHGGDFIVQGCEGWDFDKGDAQYLNGIPDNEFDFVHSSHTLEHMVDSQVALRNWWRVVKPGGYLILYLPHRDLYEKRKTLPSRWNPDHKRFFLPENDEAPDTEGLLPLIERSLTDFKIEYMKTCDTGPVITDPEIHSDGEYSIETVIKKLQGK